MLGCLLFLSDGTSIGQPIPRTTVSWSSDAALIAHKVNDQVQIVDLASLQITHTFISNSEPVTPALWNPTSEMLAVVNDNAVELWSDFGQSGEAAQIESVTTDEALVRVIEWSPDGNLLAFGTGQIHIWNRLSQTYELMVNIHHGILTDISWSPDGSLIATASISASDGVFIWDAATGEIIQQMILIRDTNRPPADVFVAPLSVAWSPDGTRLVVGGTDGSVRMWDRTLLSDEQVFTESGSEAVIVAHWRDEYGANVWSVDWSVDGEWIASGADDGKVIVFRADPFEIFREYLTLGSSGVDWSPMENQLVFLDEQGTLRTEVFTSPISP